MNKSITYHAIRVDESKCFGCTHCMKVCPTEAIRIRNGKATINGSRCVDCGNCKRVCPADAFYIEQDDLKRIMDYPFRVLIFPSVFRGQFPENISGNRIGKALTKLGFTHFFELEQPVSLLIDSIREHNRENPSSGPFISSFCPAVNRLIQIKYPELSGNIISRRPPHALAVLYITSLLGAQGANRGDIGIFYVSPCSAKIASLRQHDPADISKPDGIINMKDLYNRIMSALPVSEEGADGDFGECLSKEGMLWSLPGGETPASDGTFMAVDGIHEVVRILEKIENNEVPAIEYFEFKSCQQGCAGGILLTGSRFLTVERLRRRAERYPRADFAVPESLPAEWIKENLKREAFEPRVAFALDPNRAKALEKMMKAEKIACQLPGIDCGACGAPNCQALAEDMVQGQAKMTDCIFLQQRWQVEGKVNAERAFRNIEKLWGKERIEADCKKKGSRNEGY